MLEVLNVLTQNDSTLPHSIIFNFNGAEENILQVHCKYTHILEILFGVYYLLSEHHYFVGLL